MGEIHNKNVAICIITTMILLVGCIGGNTQKFEIPGIVQEGWDKAQNLINSTLSNINFDIDIQPGIDAMYISIKNLPANEIKVQPENLNLIGNIADLPTADANIFLTYESYKQFADNVNTLLQFLNREGGFNIKLLEKSTDEFEEISKHLNRYAPLFENYNSVITSAETYDSNDEESIKEFYIAVGVFGFELVLIFGHIWYKTTYNIVGIFYRASGLNRLAFKCPTLISSILSSAYWYLHNKLVDISSDLMKILLLSLPMDVLTDIGNI